MKADGVTDSCLGKHLGFDLGTYIIMHWTGVSTVSVQSDRVLSKVLPRYKYRTCIQALRALVCESDINTKGYGVNLFRILLVCNSHVL
jgi:hypothetical protein